MSADPKSLTPAELADLLTKSGKAGVSEQDIEADIDAGAPANDDGTVNLLHYAAWLAASR